MESQQETSVKIDEIGHFQDELEKMVKTTQVNAKEETPFSAQFKALMRKHFAYYKRSYTTIIAQLFIPLLFIIGMSLQVLLWNHIF